MFYFCLFIWITASRIANSLSAAPNLPRPCSSRLRTSSGSFAIFTDPPRFILREHFAALLVADDEAGVQFLDRSGQREAAWLGAALYHE
jgi:hypothetical protein